MRRKTWTIKSIYFPLVLLLAGGFLMTTASSAKAADKGVGATITLFSSTTGSTSFASGRWKMTDSAGHDSGWLNSGSSFSGMYSGLSGTAPYTISFKDVPGYSKPTDVTLIESGQMIQVTSTTGTQYQKCAGSNGSCTGTGTTAVALTTYNGGASSGSLTVTINSTDSGSLAASLGAQWSIDNAVTWYGSGSTVSNLVLGGSYILQFKTITGFTTPASQTVLGSASGSATGTYTANSLTSNGVTVVLLPLGIQSTGGWTVNGGGSNRATSVSGVSTYTISFTSVTGWKKPADITGSTTATLTTLTAKYGSEHVDFDNNGTTDIAWRNVSDSATLIWLMCNGAQGCNGTASTNVVGGGTVDTTTSNFTTPDTSSSIPAIVRFADFDGDGKSDILFDQSGGNYTVWLMNGVTRKMTFTFASESNKIIVGVGDFNGDGQADLLTRDTSTGALGIRKAAATTSFTGSTPFASTTAITLSDGTAMASIPYIAQGSDSAGWQVAGVADVDGDGVSDVVWRRSGAYDATTNPKAGGLAVWLLQNSTTGGTFAAVKSTGNGHLTDASGNVLVSAGNLAYTSTTGWAVQGFADVDGDGKDDVIWRRQGAYDATTNPRAGYTAVWLMNGKALKSSGNGMTSDSAGNIVSAGAYDSTTGWRVIGLGEFGTSSTSAVVDGKADILFRYNGTTGSGYTVVWFMSGKTRTSSAYTSLFAGSYATSSSSSGWYSNPLGW